MLKIEHSVNVTYLQQEPASGCIQVANQSRGSGGDSWTTLVTSALSACSPTQTSGSSIHEQLLASEELEYGAEAARARCGSETADVISDC